MESIDDRVEYNEKVETEFTDLVGKIQSEDLRIQVIALGVHKDITRLPDHLKQAAQYFSKSDHSKLRALGGETYEKLGQHEAAADVYYREGDKDRFLSAMTKAGKKEKADKILKRDKRKDQKASAEKVDRYMHLLLNENLWKLPYVNEYSNFKLVRKSVEGCDEKKSSDIRAKLRGFVVEKLSGLAKEVNRKIDSHEGMRSVHEEYWPAFLYAQELEDEGLLTQVKNAMIGTYFRESRYGEENPDASEETAIRLKLVNLKNAYHLANKIGREDLKLLARNEYFLKFNKMKEGKIPDGSGYSRAIDMCETDEERRIILEVYENNHHWKLAAQAANALGDKKKGEGHYRKVMQSKERSVGIGGLGEVADFARKAEDRDVERTYRRLSELLK